MLKKDKNGSPEWLNKLPQMAKQLEVSLYRNARSFEAYMDMSTLKQRLQQIAVEVSRKARSQGGDQRDDRHRQDMPSSSYQQQQPQQQQQPSYSSSNQMRPGPESTTGAGSPFMGISSSSQHQSMSNTQRGSQVVNMDQINLMANSGGGGSVMPSMGGGMGGGMDTSMNSSMNSGMNAPGYNGQRTSSTSQSSSSVPAANLAQNRNDPEWKVRIRHKQQRLLLLHHSAKCPHEDGRCTVTPHCADMKRLWRHMEGCKDNNCRVSHCFSSRAILSHYRKCKDPACPACGPVRETVRKSQSRNQSSSQSSQIRGAVGGSSMPSSMSEGQRQMMSTSMPPSSSSSHQQPMMPSNDMSSQRGGGSFPSQSSSMPSNFQQSQPPQPSMPPPPSGNSPGMQFSSMSSSQPPQQQPQFRSNSASVPSSSAPPPYGSSSKPQSMAMRMSNDASSSSQRPSSSSAAAMPGSSSSAANAPKRNDSEWQKVRHKQQRLLLLRHASRCQYEAGKCPVTPHCVSMKKLWEHIAHCKNQQCTVPHCMSSRYVLSHYRRCKDARCPACGPVRETIRKSHDKERQAGRQTSSGGTSFDAEVSRAPQPGDNLPPGNFDPTPIGPTDSKNLSAEYNMPAPKRMKMEPTPSGPPVAAPLQSSSQPVMPPAKPQSSPSMAHMKQAKKTPASSTPPGPVSSSSAPSEVKSTPKEATTSAASKKGSEDHSLLNGFSVEQLTTHLASLNRAAQLPPAKLKAKCIEVLKGLQTHQHGWVFNCPVDPIELGLPDYFEIIKKPMDLGSVHKKLDSGAYHAIEDFAGDCNLTFDNAMSYNEAGSVVYDMAKELKVKFQADHEKLMIQLEEEDRERRQNDRACVLCGCEKLLFEPPVFFCNGMNCQSKRIRRNSHFYIGGNNQYFWCNQCFNELDEKTPIELIDLTIAKPDLKKKKNDEVHEESWVQCDVCERWIHQICGLFNTRQNKEHHSEYCCPVCLLDKRKKDPSTPPPKPPCAVDLPRTKLSEWLESHVSKQVETKKKQLAKEKATAEVRWLTALFESLIVE
jgi:hypothetical protein